MRYLLGTNGGGTAKLGFWTRVWRWFRKPPATVQVRMHVEVLRFQQEAEAARQAQAQLERMRMR
jgi:hypothetical protein